MDGQGTKQLRNISENFNRLSRAHERYRETDRRTDDSVDSYGVRVIEANFGVRRDYGHAKTFRAA